MDKLINKLSKNIWFIFLIIIPLKAIADNPIITNMFTADPAALVYGDSVYLYTGHDEASISASGFAMYNWHVFSSADMVNWKDHGPVLSLSSFTWASANAWAGQCIERNGKFYWYVPMSHKTISGFAIGVAVADSPTGPFTDALGKALITNNMTTNVSIDWDDIDPTVFIDDDGQAYLFWGNTSCKYVKLKENMIELEGDIQYLTLPSFTEAPWIHKRNNIYYLSYAASYPEQIHYATSNSITGPWTYKGILNQRITNSPTNHQSIIQFKNQWYFIYHTAGLPTGGEFRRSVSIDYLFYNDDGTIVEIVQTSEGVDNADSTENCLPVQLKPLLKINSGNWIEKRIQTVNEGDNITLSTQLEDTVEWLWEGPGGFTDSSRQTILDNITTEKAGIYKVTFTNICGTRSYTNFTLTVLPKLPRDIVSWHNYTIKPKNSNLAVIVQNSSTSNGANIIQGELNNLATQRWRFINTESVFWKIVPINATSQSLDVYNSSNDDGANVNLWSYSSGANQQWIIIEKDSGIYNIQARHSGKCLDVDGTATTVGANVRQWTCTNSDQQQFILTDVTDFSVIDEPSINAGNIKTYSYGEKNIIVDISSIQKPLELTIINLKGEIIYKESVLNSSLFKPQYNFLPGIYIVKVLNEDGAFTTKFLIR